MYQSLEHPYFLAKVILDAASHLNGGGLRVGKTSEVFSFSLTIFRRVSGQFGASSSFIVQSYYMATSESGKDEPVAGKINWAVIDYPSGQDMLISPTGAYQLCPTSGIC